MTGNDSAFSDTETMGCVEVISTNPVKPGRFSSGPRFAEPCANGPIVRLEVPSFAPALLTTVKVTVEDWVAEGFAYATPVAVWAKVTNSVAGTVEGFRAASPIALHCAHSGVLNLSKNKNQSTRRRL
jgi:hypothetical protein